jgi:hypothetical protein
MTRDRHPGVLVGFAVGLLLRPGAGEACAVGLAVWPGGADGWLPRVAVAVEAGTLVGAPTGALVGTAAGVPVPEPPGVGEVVGGVGRPVVPAVGSVDACSTGFTLGWALPGGRTASGTGRNGECTVGPPNSVLANRVT